MGHVERSRRQRRCQDENFPQQAQPWMFVQVTAGGRETLRAQSCGGQISRSVVVLCVRAAPAECVPLRLRVYRVRALVEFSFISAKTADKALWLFAPEPNTVCVSLRACWPVPTDFQLSNA